MFDSAASSYRRNHSTTCCSAPSPRPSLSLRQPYHFFLCLPQFFLLSSYRTIYTTIIMALLPLIWISGLLLELFLEINAILEDLTVRMGRVKLKIHRLETLNSRQVSYGKRRAGILKKAQEVSVLCEIPTVLIMFSPQGKPSIFCGQRSNIDEMIAKYEQLTPKERAKRRWEAIGILTRNFEKLDRDVDVDEFLDASLASWWTNPEKIEGIEHLNTRESSLQESLNQFRIKKHIGDQEMLMKDPLVQFDCTSEVCEDFGRVIEPDPELLKPLSQFSMHFPVATINDSNCANQSWLPGGEGQQMMLPIEPQFLTNRDMEHSRNASFPTCSSYLSDVKEQDLDGSIDDYTYSPHLRLPLDDQYRYPSFGNLSSPDLMEPGKDTTLQLSSLDHQINRDFDLPRSVSNNFPPSLVPTAGSCGVSLLNDNSYPQPPN